MQSAVWRCAATTSATSPFHRLSTAAFERPALITEAVDRYGAQAMNLAWVCALVWMVHPLQTEVVDYLTERTESMMGMFYLLTLYFSVRGWPILAVLSCGLGMASKESMVTAPLLVVAYDRVYRFDSLKQAFRARKRLYLGLAATWLVLAALNWSGPRAAVGGFSAERRRGRIC
jgi:hypothetical protein